MSASPNQHAAPNPEPAALRALGRFFVTWRFPVVALALLGFAFSSCMLLLLLPGADAGVGAFAEEFRVWCLGYDPATGQFEWVYVIMLVFDPLLLAFIIWVVWRPELLKVRSLGGLTVAPYVGAGLAVVLGGGLLFGLADRPEQPNDQELPFPAEDLRTAHTPPQFELIDHTGSTLSLDDLKGRVVIITGIYASCGDTCPMILAQAKRALGSLTPEERGSVSFLGITMDPERDTPERLAAMAEAQGVEAPLFHLATGEPAMIEALLDHLEIQRSRDPETGVIEHVNLYMVIDRSGKIAYRFTLGDRQERWLATALKLLIREKNPERDQEDP